MATRKRKQKKKFNIENARSEKSFKSLVDALSLVKLGDSPSEDAVESQNQITTTGSGGEDKPAERLNLLESLTGEGLENLQETRRVTNPIEREISNREIRDEDQEDEDDGGFIGAGQRFLQGLFAKDEEAQQDSAGLPARTGEVSPRERELRDAAAIAISKGADPVKVNQRLNEELGLE